MLLSDFSQADQDAILDELISDPERVGYSKANGESLKAPNTLVKLLIAPRQIPNPEPPAVGTRQPTIADLKAAVKDPQIATLGMAGWINREEALAAAQIDLTEPDPNYEPTITAPPRLRAVLQRPATITADEVAALVLPLIAR